MQTGSLQKIHLSSPFKIRQQTPLFTGIKTGGEGKKNVSVSVQKPLRKNQANARSLGACCMNYTDLEVVWSDVCTGRGVHRVHRTLHNNSPRTLTRDTIKIIDRACT
jgi:hypothetical protein